jgi:hypothetical protein
MTLRSLRCVYGVAFTALGGSLATSVLDGGVERLPLLRTNHQKPANHFHPG